MAQEEKCVFLRWPLLRGRRVLFYLGIWWNRVGFAFGCAEKRQEKREKRKALAAAAQGASSGGAAGAGEGGGCGLEEDGNSGDSAEEEPGDGEAQARRAKAQERGSQLQAQQMQSEDPKGVGSNGLKGQQTVPVPVSSPVVGPAEGTTEGEKLSASAKKESLPSAAVPPYVKHTLRPSRSDPSLLTSYSESVHALQSTIQR